MRRDTGCWISWAADPRVVGLRDGVFGPQRGRDVLPRRSLPGTIAVSCWAVACGSRSSQLAIVRMGSSRNSTGSRSLPAALLTNEMKSATPPCGDVRDDWKHGGQSQTDECPVRRLGIDRSTVQLRKLPSQRRTSDRQ